LEEGKLNISVSFFLEISFILYKARDSDQTQRLRQRERGNRPRKYLRVFASEWQINLFS
jgi:hypothetical protein